MSTKPGRNDPCHCGGGKKYKRCHLPLDEKARPAPGPPRVEAPEPFEGVDAPALPWNPPPGGFKNAGEVFKQMTQSGFMQSDPELRRLLQGQETLLAFLGCEEEIAAATAKMEAHREEFDRLVDNEEAFDQRTRELFSEESFAPLRFTAADAETAFQKVGYPPIAGPEEEIHKVYQSAVIFLASEERRSNLSMELMMRMPKYVDQGRFIDAHIILFVADMTAAMKDEANPFLWGMFSYGLEAWANQQGDRRAAFLRELGLHVEADMNPDDLDAWVAEQAADPAKNARLERLLKAHPALRSQSTAALEGAWRNAIRLLDREDAADLLLTQEEIAPWVPFLNEKLQVMIEKYGPAEEGALLSKAQQEEAFSAVYLPAVWEMTKGVFTPERIRKLVADLKAYRKELLAAREMTAAFYALGAISHIEKEDEPELNVFLVNLCARSVFALGSDAGKDRQEDEPPAPANEPV
jgi:hypothetical protein